MTTQAELSKTYKRWAIVVDEQELRRLVDECVSSLMRDGTSDVETTFRVEFSDYLSLTQSLEDILKEENPRNRSIGGLWLEAQSHDEKITCQIGFYYRLSQTEVKVSGPDRQRVYVTLSRIDERLRRMKQWHPRGWVVGLLSGAGAFLLSLWLYTVINSRYSGLLFDAVQVRLWGILGLIGMIGIPILTGYAMSLLFPHPVFRIGDGATRHDSIKNVRSRLGWAVVAACILTPIVRLVSRIVW